MAIPQIKSIKSTDAAVIIMIISSGPVVRRTSRRRIGLAMRIEVPINTAASVAVGTCEITGPSEVIIKIKNAE